MAEGGSRALSATERLLSLMVLISGVSFSFVQANTGYASFYSEPVPSACYGSDASQVPADGLWAAASDGQDGAPVNLFENGGACGKKFTVTCTGPAPGADPDPNPCTGNSIVVVVIDKCPDGCAIALTGLGKQLDLSEKAFRQIADLTAGVVKISFGPAE